jgi:hypothetical protein
LETRCFGECFKLLRDSVNIFHNETLLKCLPN